MRRRWSLVVPCCLAVACQAPEQGTGQVITGEPTADPPGINAFSVLAPEGHRTNPEGHLQAVAGETANVVWFDRDLLACEVIEGLVDGEWRPLTHDRTRWVDPDHAVAYRLRGPYRPISQTTPRPVPMVLFPPVTGETVLADGIVAVRVAFDTPGLSGLPLALRVHLVDDDRYLAAACDDGAAPCWAADPATWTNLDDLDEDEVLALPPPGVDGGLSDVAVDLVAPGEDEAVLAHADMDLQELGYRLAWGDLHAHTNLSHDGCEDPDDDCLPDRELPAEDAFSNAARHGLDFAAVTDHAEYGSYTRHDIGVELDIWSYTQQLVTEAQDGAVVPILGYEWTGSATNTGHRTVLLEDPAACGSYRIPAGLHADSKANGPAYESHTNSTIPVASLPDDLQADLEAAGQAEGCTPSRWIAYFHHPAYKRPKAVNWTAPVNASVQDSVVEILSEHGASECADLDAEGCRWMVNEDRYTESGSVQAALQAGYKLGFVGGTDGHDGDPGSVDNGPSTVWSGSGMQHHFGPGALTGVLVPGGNLDRSTIFDAIDARRTLAASWPFRDLHLVATGSDGLTYLPGQDVPAAASPLTLTVALGDSEVQDVVVELLDEQGQQWLREEAPMVQASFDLGPGDIRYVRVRAWVEDEERRLYASPWFGEEASDTGE